MSELALPCWLIQISRLSRLSAAYRKVTVWRMAGIDDADISTENPDDHDPRAPARAVPRHFPLITIRQSPISNGGPRPGSPKASHSRPPVSTAAHRSCIPDPARVANGASMTLPAFTFQTATEILFGRGKAALAPARVAGLGNAVFLVHGATASRADWLANGLGAAGCRVLRHAVAGEPDMAMIEAATAAARGFGAQVVVSLGGGAAIDAGKAVAAMVPATRPLMDHLEVVGRGLPLDLAPLPFVALPTTAGTGAEVTRNAVIGVPDHRRKVSLRDARMLPRLAIVDPALTDHAPRSLTLASGLDAVTQVIEPYISTRANPLTDALCRTAIPAGLVALQRLMQGEDASARDALAWVSLCGGLALANAGLGVVHGLAGPLGGLADAPHGAICGALLPHGLAQNRLRVTDAGRAGRIDEVLSWIGDAFGVAAERGLVALADWSRHHGLPGLRALGFSSADCDSAAQAAQSASSMQANPVPLDLADLRAILAAAA